MHKLNQKLLRTRRGFEALAKYLVSRVCFARLLVISCKTCGGSHKLLAPDVSVTQRQEGESCRRECSYAASLGTTQLWLAADSGVVPPLLLLRDFSCLQVQIPKPKPPPGTRRAVRESDLSDRCFLLSHRHCVDAFLVIIVLCCSDLDSSVELLGDSMSKSPSKATPFVYDSFFLLNSSFSSDLHVSLRCCID